MGQFGYQGQDWSSVLSRPWNQGQYDHNSRKVNLCTRDMDFFFNCPGQENTIVKYFLYLKAKNGTDSIITCCRIDFWSELDYLVTLYMRTALTYLPAVFLSIC